MRMDLGYYTIYIHVHLGEKYTYDAETWCYITDVMLACFVSEMSNSHWYLIRCPFLFIDWLSTCISAGDQRLQQHLCGLDVTTYAPILSQNSFILLLNNHFSCVTAADANRTFISVTPSHWKLSSGRHLLWSITMWTVLLVVVYSMFYKPAHPQPFLKVHNVCASMVKLLLTAQLSSDFPSSILKQQNIHRYLKAVKPVFS